MKMTEGFRIYVAGPMESVGGNWNIPLFDYVAEKLRGRGCYVFNPADHLRAIHGSVEAVLKLDKETRKLSRDDAMKDELIWIIDNAQMVFALPGWKQSPGAMAEVAVANAVGVPVRECGTIILPTEGLDRNDKQFDNLQLEQEES